MNGRSWTCFFGPSMNKIVCQEPLFTRSWTAVWHCFSTCVHSPLMNTPKFAGGLSLDADRWNLRQRRHHANFHVYAREWSLEGFDSDIYSDIYSLNLRARDSTTRFVRPSVGQLVPILLLYRFYFYDLTAPALVPLPTLKLLLYNIFISGLGRVFDRLIPIDEQEMNVRRRKPLSI